MRFKSNILPFLTPYIAILIGLYLLKNAWVAILLYHAVILTYVIADKHPTNRRKIFIGWNIRLFLISCAISIIAGPALLLLWDLMKLENSSLTSALSMIRLTKLSWIIFIPYFCLVHPILEEFFWRGRLDNASGSGYLKDILFGGYHIPVLAIFIKPEWVFISFLILAFVSWIWRTVSDRTNGLLIPVLSHIIANASIIIAVNFILNQN